MYSSHKAVSFSTPKNIIARLIPEHLTIALFATLAFIPVGAVQAQNFIQDGGFETPVVSGYTYNPAGSSWTVSTPSGGYIISQSGSAWGGTAFDGNQFGVLQSGNGSQSYIGQDVSLIQGDTYNFNTYAEERTNYGGTDETFTAYLGTAGTFAPTTTILSTTLATTSWANYSNTFVYTGPTGLVGVDIIASNPVASPDSSVFLDDVSLAAVPAPEVSPVVSLGIILTLSAFLTIRSRRLARSKQ
jgi:hypothetical protein